MYVYAGLLFNNAKLDEGNKYSNKTIIILVII